MDNWITPPDQIETAQMLPPDLQRANPSICDPGVAMNDSTFLSELPEPGDLPGLPREFRLMSVHSAWRPDRRYQMTAVVYHEQASLRVTWTVRQKDDRLQRGRLVEIRWLGGWAPSHMGAIMIARLVPIERHRKIDVFRTVPPSWVKDNALRKRASILWQRLSEPCQELLAAIFWDGERFARFCAAPSSCIGHHREWGGNFRHAVETAEAALALLPQFPNAEPSLVITVALLHDAGKAEEYEFEDGFGNRLSDWGRLVSHRPTVTFWIGEVHRSLRHRLPDAMLQSLLHAINATKGPKELGCRNPVTPEAILLGLADGASGIGDLIRKQSTGRGWGKPHRHFGDLGPFVTAG
jgi:3'-5' exoribonuclease